MHGIRERDPRGPETGTEPVAAAVIGRLRAATVFVDDIERARRFYVETLGFEERVGTAPAALSAEVAPPGASTSLVLVTPSLSGMGIERASVARQRIGEPTGLFLEVEDVEEACRALRARGVGVGEPLATGGPGPAATFRDPDGNELALVEARPAGGEAPARPAPS